MADNITGEQNMPLDRRDFLTLGATGLVAGSRIAEAIDGSAAAMLQAAPASGFDIDVLASTGESFAGYQPPGILDGTAAWRRDADTVRLFVNHELPADAGEPWALENGLQMRGARISWFDIDVESRSVRGAGNAIRTIRDRRGEPVQSTEQIHEQWGSDKDHGLNTLCSAQGYAAGDFGFVDNLMFTCEEVSAEEDHPHGGSLWALEPATGELWALPELGRGSWENVTALATPDNHKSDGHIALLLADDYEFGAAPLYLWIGRKQPDGNFVARNGLAQGQLFVWSATDGQRSPEDWNGTGESAAGNFIAVQTRDVSQAGRSGHDRDGYFDDVFMREQARRLGAFMFSRPEDLHTNPANPSQVAFASCGHGKVFPADDWGTVYLIETQIEVTDELSARASMLILHDCDDYGDYGIRNADNLVWASDGMLYIQEDKATKLRHFGGQTGREASIWRLNPEQPTDYSLVATIDRSSIWPRDARDILPRELGAWESSGILDVSAQFGAGNELLMIATVQAHSVRGGSLGGRSKLVQGAQLVIMSRRLDNA